MRITVAALLAVLTLLAACGSEEPGTTSGALTATLVSPNGAEGAAHVTLIGTGITAVRALDARTYSHVRGDTVSVVIVRDTPGELRFLVDVDDLSLPPGGAVLEVAGGDNRLRADLQAYRLEVRP